METFIEYRVKETQTEAHYRAYFKLHMRGKPVNHVFEGQTKDIFLFSYWNLKTGLAMKTISKQTYN